jgi:hypothetical protein
MVTRTNEKINKVLPKIRQKNINNYAINNNEEQNNYAIRNSNFKPPFID